MTKNETDLIIAEQNKSTEEMAKQYAISRTYPKFETDYIANFVLREVEGAFLAGSKVKEAETIKSANTEILLQELKDRGVIRSWYYNGDYHVGNELPQSVRMNFNRTKF